MEKWEKIQEALNHSLEQIDVKSKEDLIQQLSIYHEELYFQNEELKRINSTLLELKDDYKELFDFSPVGYVVVDKEGASLQHNKIIDGWFGTDDAKKFMNYVAPCSQNDFYFFFKRLKDFKESRVSLLMLAGEKTFHMDIIGKPISSKTDHYLLACIDVEEQFKALERIKELSFNDQLTGLFNRRYYETELIRLNHTRMMPISIILGDVNGLKLVNDAFGHQTGDQLLIKSAEILSSNNRGTDIIARIGGDEFAILLPNTNKEDCTKIMNRLQMSCGSIQVEDIHFSISFGSATMTAIHEDLEEVVSSAEEAMYRSKLLEESSRRGEFVQYILATLHEKHPREEMHSIRVSEHMKLMGDALGFDKNRIEMMRVAGLLHDIGKIAIDYAILDKRTQLSEEDYNEIKRHPEIGYRILKSSSVFSEVSNIVLHHHERMDGRGYPRGVSGEDIPMEARILTICDAYDAMVSQRPYRQPLSQEEALKELIKGSGDQFDKRLVEVFIRITL